MIRAPRHDEIPLLPQIENAADRRYACAAREPGLDTLYLSTYLRVPWNAPFYARRGFVEVPRGKWPRAFRLQFMAENGHGHPAWQRTIMKRDVKEAYLQPG